MKKALYFLTIFFTATIFLSSPTFANLQKVTSTIESLNVDPTRGTMNLSVPIDVPQGRGGIQPNVSLLYNSSSANGLFGMGWLMDFGSIQRSTKRGVPKYDNTDTFVLIQSGSQQELVDISGTNTEFQPKQEGAFMKIEFVGGTHWVTTDKKGVKYYFGQALASRQYDPANSSKVFKWYLDRVEDLQGNFMTFSYTTANDYLYPDEIHYTGNSVSAMPTFAKVKFLYETRSDTTNSYIAGFKSDMTKRVSSIELSVDSVTVQTYQMNYTPETETNRSTLSNITQIGSDGLTTLPPTTFIYSQGDSDVMNAVNFNNNPASHIFGDQVRLFDVNSDGAPDIVNGIDANYQIYFNRSEDGTVSFDPPVTASASPSVGLDHTALKLVDFDADGLLDIIYGESQPWTIWRNNGVDGFDAQGPISNDPAMALNMNVVHFVDMNGDGLTDILESYAGTNDDYKVYYNSGNFDFDPAVIMTNSPTFGTANPDVQIADFSGDGLPDVIYGINCHYKIWENTGQSGFNGPVAGGSCPYHPISENNILRFVDMNGDGLLDLLDSYTGTNQDYTIYLNNGSLKFEAPITAVNSPIVGTNNGNVQVIDFNGDGLQDIFYGEPAAGNPYQVWLNNGVNGFHPPRTLSDYPDTGVGNGGNTIVDINADGLPDLVRGVPQEGPYKAWINKHDPLSPRTATLVKVQNPIGGEKQISYKGVRLKCLLGPQYNGAYSATIFNTVKAITETNAQGSSVVADHLYKDCFWSFTEREFRGYAYVKITDADGNYTETTFLQDDIFKGRMSEQKRYDVSGALFSKTVNTWDSQTLNPGVNFVFLKRVDNFVYDGDATGKRTAQEFFYEETPQMGHLTKTIQLGEVDLTTGADVGTDTRTIITEYVGNAAAHLFGLPKRVEVQDHLNAKARETWFYYDNNLSVHDTPLQGLLTKKEDWAGAGGTNPVTTYSYNMYGNLLTTTDPKNNITTITYDPLYEIFPVTTQNAMSHSVTNEYYGVNGIAADNGLWGQLKSTTDPNQQQGVRTYDVFGRLKETVSPLDSMTHPTTMTEYEVDAGQLYKITTKQRKVHTATGTIDTIEFYDGLGRLMQAKSKSETDGEFIVHNQTEYDDRGLPVRKYLPYTTTTALNLADPVNISKPHATLEYDCLGRLIKTTNPDGTYSTVSYDDWITTTINENGHMQKSHFDAYGRLIKKEEYTGADGRSAHYPASPYTLYATTLYEYDSEGNLVKTTDAHGNVTTIAYDELGRKTSMIDPDMGAWQYNYDENGNLTSQIDAKLQQVDFTYDSLNRLGNKSDAVMNVNYNYDDVLVNFAKGRLTKADYGLDDHTDFQYDELGRETISKKMIDGANYEVKRGYDALNRLTDIEYPNQQKVYYKYNAAGQIEAVADTPFAPEAPPAVPMDPAYAHYKLNDSAANTTVSDTGTGLNNAATVPNNTQTLSTAGHINSAFNFDGPVSQNCVDASPMGSQVWNDTTGAASFWVKDVKRDGLLFTLTSHNSSVILGMGAVQVGPSKVRITLDEDGVIFQDATWNAPANYFNDGQWHHIVFSQDGTALKLYVDDTPQTLSGTNTGGWFASLSEPYGYTSIGCRITFNSTGIHYDNHSEAVIDDFRYYRVSVSADEVSALYNAGLGTEEESPLVGSGTPPPPPPPPPGGTAMDSPHAHYMLNDNAADTIVDDTGIGFNDGTSLQGNTQTLSAVGHMDKAFNFDGVNRCVETNAMGTQIWNDTTGAMSFWVKDAKRNALLFTVTSQDSSVILGQGAVMVGPYMVRLTLDENGVIYQDAQWNGGTDYFNDGAWHHIVFSHDGTGLKLHVDGVERTLSGTNTGQWFAALNEPYGYASIGCRTTFNSTGIHYDNHSEVQLDDFRYYSKGLSTEEVAALYNNGAGTEEENPVLEQAASEMPTGNAPNPGQYVMNVDYTPAGQIKRIEYGSGSVTAYFYDSLNLRLTRMVTVDQNSTMIQDLNYTYDSVGNILSITDAVNTDSQTFQYDALNRLTQAVGASYGTKNYSYDEIGNITEKDGLTYTYGEGNAGPHAVTSLSDGTTFTYDANGNMATMQKGAVLTQYLYDSENRLIEVLEDSVLKVSFEYDGDSGRTKKTVYGATTTTTHFMGSLYEKTGTQTTEYVFLGNTRVASIINGSVKYHHTNHLGGANILTDDIGVVKELVEYTPYGSFARHEKYGSSEEIARFYFSGQKFEDEAGLYYYGNRYYNPEIGRFLTADIIVPHPRNPQALNRYAYAGNNPVTYLEDGNGWFIPFIIAAVKGAAIGAAIGAATAAITGGDIGKGALFGAIGGAAFAGMSSVFTNLAKFTMFGTTNVSVIGNTATTLNIISGAVGGAAGGAAFAGAAGSNVGRGALAGFTAATIAGVGSGVWPLGAAAVGGGAAAEIEGGEFGEGAKFAAIGRSMATMLELALPADTIGEQNPQPGDLAYMKPENPLSALISLLEGGPFSHVKILDDQGRWISATPGRDVGFFSYDEYAGRRGKIVRRFRGNQRVIAAAKAQAVTNPPLPYNFVIGGRGRVCSTCVGNAISVGAGIQWTGIGPNSQFNVLRSYGE